MKAIYEDEDGSVMIDIEDNTAENPIGIVVRGGEKTGPVLINSFLARDQGAWRPVEKQYNVRRLLENAKPGFSYTVDEAALLEQDNG